MHRSNGYRATLRRITECHSYQKRVLRNIGGCQTAQQRSDEDLWAVR